MLQFSADAVPASVNVLERSNPSKLIDLMQPYNLVTHDAWDINASCIMFQSRQDHLFWTSRRIQSPRNLTIASDIVRELLNNTINAGHLEWDIVFNRPPGACIQTFKAT
jgi:hypothetical protein